jgi:hypothetical protein
MMNVANPPAVVAPDLRERNSNIVGREVERFERAPAHDRLLTGPSIRTKKIKDPDDPDNPKKVKRVRVGEPGDLKTLYGINYCREQLYRLAREGDFPAPIRLGGNRSAYRESEIIQWINSRERAVKVRRRESRNPRSRKSRRG